MLKGNEEKEKMIEENEEKEKMKEGSFTIL